MCRMPKAPRRSSRLSASVGHGSSTCSPMAPMTGVTSPGKVDTGLCGFPVCLLWGDITDSGVDPPTIVIGFDVREHVAPSGLAIGIVALVDELGFQGAEEALHRCIVPAVSLAAH